MYNTKKSIKRNMPKKIYLNDMQQEVITTGAKDSVVVAGRGTGKGLLHALWNLRNMQRMPGSCTGIVGANAKRVITNTLPSMLTHWESWGYLRGTHWMVGRRPPKSWPRPQFEPDTWDNVLSFYTGAIGLIISQERTGTSNSLSLDALDIDEAKFINFERLKDETFPANRGHRDLYGQHYFHHGMLITSDMPVTKKGSWFLGYEQKSDPQLIEDIQALVLKLWKMQQHVRELRAVGDEPSRSYLSSLKDYHLALCQMRSQALLYREYPSLVNLPILGEQWFRDMKRDLPPLTYRTSVMCQRIGLQRDGFYSGLRPSHFYHASNLSYLDSMDYRMDRMKERPSSLQDADVDRDAPLCIGMDYNANINWLVVAQPQGRKLRVLKSFYVKYERKLPELIDDFSVYYRHHRDRTVIFYYDSTALGSNYAVNDQDFRYVIIDELARRGWTVYDRYIGRPMNHIEKMLLINRGLAGQGGLMPLFNEVNNEDLLISIKSAGVYNGGKDKRGEKLAETEEDRLEGRTDGSDAFDTVYIGCTRFPVTGDAIM